MKRFEVGDQVRIDIPDQDDPDFDEYHGQTGEIIGVIKDDAGLQTGDERDSHVYRVELSKEASVIFAGVTFDQPTPSDRSGLESIDRIQSADQVVDQRVWRKGIAVSLLTSN